MMVVEVVPILRAREAADDDDDDDDDDGDGDGDDDDDDHHENDDDVQDEVRIIMTTTMGMMMMMMMMMMMVMMMVIVALIVMVTITTLTQWHAVLVRRPMRDYVMPVLVMFMPTRRCPTWWAMTVEMGGTSVDGLWARLFSSSSTAFSVDSIYPAPARLLLPACLVLFCEPFGVRRCGMMFVNSDKCLTC